MVETCSSIVSCVTTFSAPIICEWIVRVVRNYNVLGIESWKNQERKWYTDLQGDSCIYRGKETGWTPQSSGSRKTPIPKCIKGYHQCCCYGGDLLFDWIVDKIKFTSITAIVDYAVYSSNGI